MDKIKMFFKTWQTSSDFFVWYMAEFDTKISNAKNQLNALRTTKNLEKKDVIFYRWVK
jgi:hypothetical protein